MSVLEIVVVEGRVRLGVGVGVGGCETREVAGERGEEEKKGECTDV